MSAAVTFAFGAGLLATVNPCGFAMLPSFLSLYLGTEAGSENRPSLIGRASQGFGVGLVLSAAFGSVFVIAGLIVTAGLRSFISVVPWIALAIGAVLLVLGAAMLLGRHVTFVPASRVGVRDQGTGFGRVALFGASYAVASLSCTFAVFLIVVSQAVSVGNPVQVLAVFGSYAAGSATVLIALSLSAAIAGGALARLVRRSLRVVNRVSGALLALSGVYLIAYWLPSVTSGNGGTGASSSAARWTEHISSTLTTFLDAHTATFALVLAGFVVSGIALLVVNATRGTAEEEADCCAPVLPVSPKRADVPAAVGDTR